MNCTATSSEFGIPQFLEVYWLKAESKKKKNLFIYLVKGETKVELSKRLGCKMDTRHLKILAYQVGLILEN